MRNAPFLIIFDAHFAVLHTENAIHITIPLSFVMQIWCILTQPTLRCNG